MAQTSRSAILTGFADVVGAAGGNPLALVHAAGLPGEVLRNPDLRVPTLQVLSLLEASARAIGCYDLGLRIAAHRGFATLGPLGLAMREQANVRGAIALLAENLWAQSEGLVVSLEEAEGIGVLVLTIPNPPQGGARQASELSLASMTRLLRRLLGPHWRPEMVLFRHPRPADYAPHVRLFGLAPLFAQERDALVLLQRDLDAAIPDADPDAAAQLARFLALEAGSRAHSTADRVRRIVALLLPRGECRIERVAAQFGVDRRTLHRRLAAEGTSFRELVAAERASLAASLLAGGRSKTEVAGLLGFASLSAFSRWRRLTGGEDGSGEASGQGMADAGGV